MSIVLDAVYENGTIRLPKFHPLKESQKVKVIVPELGDDAEDDDDDQFLTPDEIRGFFFSAGEVVPAAPSLADVRRMLSKIPGSMAEAVSEERDERF